VPASGAGGRPVAISPGYSVAQPGRRGSAEKSLPAGNAAEMLRTLLNNRKLLKEKMEKCRNRKLKIHVIIPLNICLILYKKRGVVDGSVLFENPL
jgi:hypothetical protein